MSPGSEERSVVLDAALWNLPRLRRDPTPDVTHFIEAFSRRLDPDSIPEPRQPLDLAAVGVAADVQGDAERAGHIFAELAQLPSEAGLLGMFLTAWSATAQDPRVLAAPLQAIESIPNDPLLQARLCCKLITAAYAHRWDDALPDLFARAQAWAPEGSMIAAMLMGEAYNLLGAKWPSDWAYEPDELTSYDWISELAWSATAKNLTQQVNERARSPWTITIGGGFSETEDVIAAFMQTEWAGAIWLRRQISEQLAAHILLDDSAQPQPSAIAVSLWALNSSGPSNLDGVVELAEPRFDSESADQIVGEVNRGEPLRTWNDLPLIELSVALWDLISDRTAIALLDRLPLVASDHPNAARVAAFWALASVRIPAAWLEHFEQLDVSQRRQLLRGLSPAIARRLPEHVGLRLVEASPKPRDDLHEAHIIGVLANLAGRPDVVDLSSAPAASVVRLGRDALPLVQGRLLDRAIEQLIDECRETVGAARRGSRGMGGYEPFAMLALGYTVRPDRDLPDALAIFEEAATDASVPADVRYEAIRGLTVIAHQVGLPSNLVARIGELPEAGAAPIFEFVTPQLFHAARIALLVACGREGLEAELLMLVRDEEPQVRQLAVEATALAIEQRPSEAVEGALASALFDPDEATVRMALGAVHAVALRTSAVRLAIGQRLVTLFDKGGRTVRATVVYAVKAGVMPSEQRRQAESLLSRAEHDRSFQVRDAASGEPSAESNQAGA